MAKATAAIDFLADPQAAQTAAVVAIFGDDAFLRRQALVRLRAVVLEGEEAAFSYFTFPGDETEWRDVFEELATVAMFGGGKRLVVVEEGDQFVTRYRDKLEDYVAKPQRTGVLVLELKSFPGNTRLHKAVVAGGLAIDCSTPKGAGLTRWLGSWARQVHQVELPAAAADMLLDLIGPELGLIDQEIGKLALLAGEKRKITTELVTRSVGSWRAQTAWVMLDAALEGNAGDALTQLDRLLASGEQPIGILAQISSSLRRLAAATRLVLQGEETGRRPTVRQALEAAGVNPFYLQKTEKHLRRLGRHRGATLYRWLLEADLDLKGDSRLPPRLILERLILRLAASEPAAPQTAGRGVNR